MATITTSVLVSSENRGGMWKKNLYRYTLSTGEVHERRSWISASIADADDMAARGDMLLTELAQAEIDGLLG